MHSSVPLATLALEVATTFVPVDAWSSVPAAVPGSLSDVAREVPAVVAQARPGEDVGVGSSLVGSAVVAFFSTLVVAGLLVLLVPEYVDRMLREVADGPLVSFLVGFVALIVLAVVTVVLAITIVGLLVAIPLLFLLWLLWAVGGAIAYLAIADRIVGRDDGWTKPVVVAAAISGALALTGIGGLLSFGIGATGFGAVLRDLLG